jgi:hypothetical protein
MTIADLNKSLARVDNVSMRLGDGALIHQVHPAKLGADITAAVVSNVLLWQERPKAAMVVRIVLPMAGSAAVLSVCDLDGLSRTRRGRYVLAHMPPSAQAVRLAGDALMGLGAYRRSARLLLAGAMVVGIGWSHPLWPLSQPAAKMSGPGWRRPPGR